MIRNEDILCISTIDWDFIWQSQQEIMSTFADNGSRVLFIDNTGIRAPSLKDYKRIKNRILNWRKGVSGIRKEFTNLYVYSPIVFPFPYSRLFRLLNKQIVLATVKRWMRLMNFSNPIIWVYLPTGLAVDLIRDLNPKASVYYSVDEYCQISPEPKRIKRSEDILIKESDIVFTTSRKRFNNLFEYNENTYFFPDGLSNALCREIGKPAATPSELKGLRRPVLGYVGGIHKWLDQDLIYLIAKNRPDLSIVMVGPIQCDISRLSALSNISFLGKKEHRLLADYIKAFDVCLIPYKSTGYTNVSYPNKAIEYMAFGKPIVSTALGEFSALFSKEVYFAEDSGKFMEGIEKALGEDNDELRERRVKCAKDNSWDKRIEEMSDIIQNTINKKIMQKDAGWKEILRSFENGVKQKIIKFSLASLALYLLFFYTPIVWFLAGPLKINQPPQKADAIVVFAGGVGESGNAGQGYEERVKCAVELYNKGYAKQLVFSSGYMYVFNEPMVMKALAVSLGVPENAIILENKARNTYENVLFTREILARAKWDKIILVSSPYHMRRVSSVFNKIARGINVRYVPISKSLFYSRPYRDALGKRLWKQVNIRQIKGIFHEYLGILFYKLKGYA